MIKAILFIFFLTTTTFAMEQSHEQLGGSKTLLMAAILENKIALVELLIMMGVPITNEMLTLSRLICSRRDDLDPAPAISIRKMLIAAQAKQKETRI